MDPHDDEQIHDPIQFSFPFTAPDFRYLMPDLMLDISSTSYHRPSALSPLSPASSNNMDPPQTYPLLPEFDTNIDLGIAPEIIVGSEGDDMLPAFPSVIGQGLAADEPFHPNTQPMLDPCHLPIGSAPNSYQQFETGLEQLASTVQECITKLPPAQLTQMRDHLRDKCNWLETTIQDKIDSDIRTPTSTNSVNSNNVNRNRVTRKKEKFYCLFCPSHKRRTYNSRGTFKRHLYAEHEPRRQYFCPRCQWSSYRSDKVHAHFEARHPPPKPRRISSITLKTPAFCKICHNKLGGWESYLDCAFEHCRFHNAVSPGTSAHHSRRNSDASGSGGSGNNDNHAPENPFGGPGLESQFPSGGGNNPTGGDSFYPGNEFNSYGNSGSSCNNAATLAEQSLLNTLGTIPDMDDGFSGSESTYSCSSDEKGSEADQLKSTDLLDQYQLLQSSLERSSPSIPSEKTPAPSDENRRHYPREPSDTTSRHDTDLGKMTPLKKVIDKAPKKHTSPEPDNLPPKERKKCGHNIIHYPKCQLQKGVADQCHLCADKACKQHALEEARAMGDYYQYFDFACNGMSDRSRSAWRISRALNQASQVFQSQGLSSSTENQFITPAKKMPTDAKLYESYDLTSFVLECYGIPTRKLTIGASEETYELTTPDHPGAVCKPSSCQTVATIWLIEQTVSRLLHAPNSSRAARLEAFSLNTFHYETTLARPYTSVALSLYEFDFEPGTSDESPEKHGSFHRASYVVQNERSLQHCLPLRDVHLSTTNLASRRRRLTLRAKLQVIIEILVLQASVTSRFPVCPKPEDRSLNGLNAKPETGLLAVSTDLDSFDPRSLPHWIQEGIFSFSAGLVDHIDSTMLATPIYKVDEVRMKISTLVDSLTCYLETPINPTAIEKQPRNLGFW
ncbi:hypothetical protein BBP40_006810 [Aspergillus hancockii]|nr:hypothetical protein BBP40_006810 [Aspergillus hancockii]